MSKVRSVPIDSSRVIQVAKVIDESLAPGARFARDPDRESMTQLLGLLVLVEKRMNDARMPFDVRAKYIRASRAILKQHQAVATAAGVALAAEAKPLEQLADATAETKPGVVPVGAVDPVHQALEEITEPGETKEPEP